MNFSSIIKFPAISDEKSPDKMKTGVNNNNNNNRIYDKFQNIENISNNNSSDILSYSNISNNNVYAHIAEIDDSESHNSLMYSQNNAQWGNDRYSLNNNQNGSDGSSRKPFDDQNVYLTNSTVASRSVNSSSYGIVAHAFI